jgi:hypothetical protein
VASRREFKQTKGHSFENLTIEMVLLIEPKKKPADVPTVFCFKGSTLKKLALKNFWNRRCAEAMRLWKIGTK